MVCKIGTKVKTGFEPAHTLCNMLVFIAPFTEIPTSASSYQSRSSMHIQGLIPRNSTELAEAVPIDITSVRIVNEFLILCFGKG